MIKLIVSDVDGTIVPDGTADVNPRLFEVIRRLREKGIQFAIASGRQWASVENTFGPVKEKLFYIADNGAYIGCYGRSLYEYPMDRELVTRVIERAKAHGDLGIVYGAGKGDYIEEGNTELYRFLAEGYRYKVDQVPDLLKVEEPCIKLSLYRPERIEEATADLFQEFGSQLKVTCAGEMWVDFMAPGINKGRAVRTIQESLGIAIEETMAFGDQLNDLEMLGQAYYSFAVANAREEVRQAARFQTDSNVNDGVLKILEGLL